MKKKERLDIFGEPLIEVPKCKNCGKPRYNHRASDKACPVGRKHRSLGYTSYNHSSVYEPKINFSLTNIKK